MCWWGLVEVLNHLKRTKIIKNIKWFQIGCILFPVAVDDDGGVAGLSLK